MSKTQLDRWDSNSWRDDGNEYDWWSAFYEATQQISTIPGHECSAETFGLDDIKRVIASQFGENDELSWLALVELNDGRFAFVDASCDYTGWDCQAGGHSTVCADLQVIARLGLDQEARARLGVSVYGNTEGARAVMVESEES